MGVESGRAASKGKGCENDLAPGRAGGPIRPPLLGLERSKFELGSLRQFAVGHTKIYE